MSRDAGTDLRRALGLPEPGPSSYAAGYHGGYRTEEDRRDFEDIERRMDEQAAEAAVALDERRVA
jgi:hypothetical protein